MDYRVIHDRIIARALFREKPQEYTEIHHIIPKSMGGSNDKSNVVTLTAREHYIVHWLLFKIHKNKEMAYAWHRMTHGKKSVSRYVSHSFSYARKTFSEYISALFKGRKLSEEHRRSLSAAKLGKTYAEIGRGESAIKGRKLSESHKIKLSITSSGRKHTDDAKRKCSISKIGSKNPMFGKKTPSSVADKIGVSLKGRDMPHKREIRSTNKSGIVGVSYSKSRRKWVASIMVNGVAINLGRFDDFCAAVDARKNAELNFLEGPHEPKKYTIEDLKEIKAVYTLKYRELLKQRGQTC